MFTNGFFYRIFRSQFQSTQKLEKSSSESLLLPQLLGGENDSKQSDEFQAITSTLKSLAIRAI